MSASTTDPASIKQHRQSLWRIINLLLLIICCLCLNYLSCHRHASRDLNQDQRYSLASQSLRFLQSEGIQKRHNPLKVIFVFRRTTPYYSCMRAMLEDYQRQSQGKVSFEMIEPLRNPARARQVANQYGIEFNQNLVIVDARQQTDSALQSQLDANAKGNTELAHVRFLSGDNLLVKSQQKGKAQKVVGLNLEAELTAAIHAAMEGQARKFYLIADKSGLNSIEQGSNSAWDRLDKTARELNISLTPLRIAELQSIPEDAQGVAIIAPQHDFSPSEIACLEQYWNRPKANIFCILNPVHESRQLRIFLRKLGLTPSNDRIVRLYNNQPVFDVTATFLPGPEYTRDFWSSSSVFEGQSSSIRIENNDKLAQRMIQAYALVVAGKNYYGESKHRQGEFIMQEREDNFAPLALAAAVERGNSNDPKLAATTARLCLINNFEFLAPNKIKAEQVDFMRSLLAWMVDRNQLTGTAGKRDFSVKLSTHPQVQSLIELILIIIAPSLCIGMALLVWRNRRS